MDIGEIIKAAAEPADRLIDAVSHAIGMAYEPRYIRRKADAKAYEIETVAKAIRDNTDLPIKYTKSNGVSIDTLDCESLIKRAGIRLAYQEVIRQENMEDILDDAYVSLLDVHTKSEKEISREWMNRFLDFAGDISSDELKHIWSKVLAGEVVEPSTFSLRTLDCLRNISSSDAKLFSELCRYTVPQHFMINDSSFLKKHKDGKLYEMILKLDECGLINSTGTVSRNIDVDGTQRLIIDFNDYVLFGNSEQKVEVSFSHFPLTEAGRELSTIVTEKIELNTIKEVCEIVAKRNKSVEFTLHKVACRNQSGFDYENEILDKWKGNDVGVS